MMTMVVIKIIMVMVAMVVMVLMMMVMLICSIVILLLYYQNGVKHTKSPNSNQADRIFRSHTFDLLRDFRNRGTGVGGGATRTWMFDENISARFCVHRGVFKVLSPSSTFFLTDDSCLHDLS